jgi:hypothetical protein
VGAENPAGRCPGHVKPKEAPSCPTAHISSPDRPATSDANWSGCPLRPVDAFFDFYADGALDESHVLPTVQEVTGQPPATFRDWGRRHAAEFASAG